MSEQRLLQRDVLAEVARHLSECQRKAIGVFYDFDPKRGMSDDDAAVIRAAASDAIAFPSLDTVAAMTPATATGVLGAFAAALDFASHVFRLAGMRSINSDPTSPAVALQAEIATLYATLLNELFACRDDPACFRGYFDAVFPLTYSPDLVTAVLAALVTRFLVSVVRTCDDRIKVVFPLLTERLTTIPPTQAALMAEIAGASREAVSFREVPPRVRPPPRADAGTEKDGSVAAPAVAGLGPNSFGSTLEFRVLSLIELSLARGLSPDGSPEAAATMSLIGLLDTAANVKGIPEFMSVPTSHVQQSACAAALALRIMPQLVSLYAKLTATPPEEYARLFAGNGAPATSFVPVQSVRMFLGQGDKRTDQSDSDWRARAELVWLMRATSFYTDVVSRLVEHCDWAAPVPGSEGTAGGDGAAWTDAICAAKAAIAAVTPAPAAVLVTAAREISRCTEEQAKQLRAAAQAAGWTRPGSENGDPMSGDELSVQLPQDDFCTAVIDFCASTFAQLAPLVGGLPASVRETLARPQYLLPLKVQEPTRHLQCVRAAARATTSLALRVFTAIVDSDDPSGDFIHGWFPMGSGLFADLIRGPRPSVITRAPGTAVGLPGSAAEAALDTDAPDTALVRALSRLSFDARYDTLVDVITCARKDNRRISPPGTELLPVLVRAGLFKALSAFAAELASSDYDQVEDLFDSISHVVSIVTPQVAGWLFADGLPAWEGASASVDAQSGELSLKDGDGKLYKCARVSQWTAEWARGFIAEPLREMNHAGVSWSQNDAVAKVLEFMTQ